MIEETFITQKEALEILKVSRPTLLKLVKDKKLKRFQAEGLQYRFRKTEVQSLWSKIYK